MLGKLQKLKWGNKKQEPESSAKPPLPQEPVAAPKHNAAEQLNDPSEKKRIAACLNIKDTALLLKACRDDASEKVRQTAARQYARHLPGGEDTKALVSQYLSSDENRNLAILITALHNDAEIRDYGLAKFTTDDDLSVIATETRFHDTRDTVTTQLQSLEAVDTVWRSIKSKDKVVARKLKERLSAHQDRQQQIQEQQAEVTRLIDEMDKLANGVWSPNFANRYDLFAGKWDAIDFEIDSQQKQQFEHLRKSAGEKVESNRALAEQHSALEACIQQMKSSEQALRNSDIKSITEHLPNSQAQLQKAEEHWQQVNSTADSVDEALEKSYSSARARLKQQLTGAESAHRAYAAVDNTDESDVAQLIQCQKQLEKAIAQGKSGSTPAAYAAELPNLLQTIESRVKKQTQANAELKSSIHKQFGSLNSAISANKWGPAKAIHERLGKKIARLPAKDQTALNEKLQRMEQRLSELGDWKQFATDPKLVTLCEQMEGIPSLKLAPKDQADRIKELQTQWKAMGASPAQEQHWPRFKAAADIAFEPCAKYFAERRAEKDNKLAAREEVLTMLQQYSDKTDWQNADWKLVEKTIRTAKNEWRKLRVFDRKATAEQEQKFTDVLAVLNEKLAPAYEEGSREKQDLIDKVKALGEGEINQHCINQVKRLQSMWRRTGIVKRSDDQRLWKEFNEACSEIYNTHRGNQREQYKASVEHVTRAKEIIKELKQAGNNGTFDEKSLQQLQDEFQSLPEFPEKEQKYLFRDFNRAVDGLDKQRQRHSENARSKELQRLQQNAAICDQLESLAGQSAETISAEIQQLLDQWDDGEKTDNIEWKKAMNLRKDSIVAHLQSGSVPDFETNTMARRLLCIDLEVLLDKETPSEDKTLRMQHQLEQLQQGMTSRSVTSTAEQVQALEVKWLTSFPAHADHRDKLNSRFTTALGKA